MRLSKYHFIFKKKIKYQSKIIILLCLFVFSACGNQTTLDEDSSPNKATEQTSEDPEILSYQGSWFEIKYPSDFDFRPDNIQNLNGRFDYHDTDEAYFTAPDQAVEFYVFSPQWGGEPDYLNLADNEVELEKQVDESEIQTITTVKIKDENDEYFREYKSIKQYLGESELHHVFGIKYTTEEDYNFYQDDYLNFQNSLIQYAD